MTDRSERIKTATTMLENMFTLMLQSVRPSDAGKEKSHDRGHLSIFTSELAKMATRPEGSTSFMAPDLTTPMGHIANVLQCSSVPVTDLGVTFAVVDNWSNESNTLGPTFKAFMEHAAGVALIEYANKVLEGRAFESKIQGQIDCVDVMVAKIPARLGQDEEASTLAALVSIIAKLKATEASMSGPASNVAALTESMQALKKKLWTAVYTTVNTSLNEAARSTLARITDEKFKVTDVNEIMESIHETEIMRKMCPDLEALGHQA